MSLVVQLLLMALDVPFVQQTAAACGPASAAMVMQYWARERPQLSGLAAAADRVARTPVPATGVTGSELKRLLEDSGFRAFILSAERRDLEDHLAKGRPLIVCFAPAGKSGPLHYAVVTGIDSESIVLNDPTRGKLFRESFDRFLKQWSATGNWTLLAVPQDSP